MKAAYITLGCKVNRYDTDAMQEILEQNGFITVDEQEQPDVFIINTCTVTNIADRKSRQMIHKAAKNGSTVIVCGCLAQSKAEELLAIEGVGAVLGTNNRGSIYEIVMSALSGKKVNAVGDIAKEKSFEQLKVTRSSERTRAHIKICEGCNNFCSYCIIPYVRGRVRSRAVDDILCEAQVLADSGVQEVVLTGINLGSYGKDGVGSTLADVIEAVCAVDGIKRVRLGSLEPVILTEEFCRRLSLQSKVCKHFHISMQSGCTSVLARMNRHYTAEELYECTVTLRKFFDNPALTADIIAGFVAETALEHKATLELVKKIGFSRVHVFPYSVREGTKAAKLQGNIPISERKKRGLEIADAAQESAQSFAQSYVGKTVEVLFEQFVKGSKELCSGLTDTYITVIADGKPNQFAKVFIERREETTLYGRVLKEEI